MASGQQWRFAYNFVESRPSGITLSISRTSKFQGSGNDNGQCQVECLTGEKWQSAAVEPLNKCRDISQMH